jgi:hypothetical protein
LICSTNGSSLLALGRPGLPVGALLRFTTRLTVLAETPINVHVLHIAIEPRNSGIPNFQQFAKHGSFGNAKKHGQGPLNFHQCVDINAPERWPHLIALHSHGLVHHDLGRFL